jgi:hypothetical protein
MVNLDTACLFEFSIQIFPTCIKEKGGKILSQNGHSQIRE